MHAATRAGLLYGLVAYVIWGVVPIYFKSVDRVPAEELLAHRIVWSAALLVAVLTLLGRFRELLACFGHSRSLMLLLASTLFIATNWYVYIHSVLSNQIMQGSLGYFILPLVNVAIGTIFFQERMRPLQWIALSFAVIGVAVLTVWDGTFPWIALTLAFTFSIYGVLRKQAAVDGMVGLTVETLLLAPFCLVYLGYYAWKDQLVFGHGDYRQDALVILSGVVTSIPLICFAQAVQRLRIVTIGFLQYISPSLAFILAVTLYGEEFKPVYQAGYSLIWCGLAIFVFDALRQAQRPKLVVEERKEAEVAPFD
jgi:chloramphenicol-sensitive protein RarD